tara:strand:- start:66 stop:1994 length:1929 start_codon:yes stop_codon:yes gene_type:complete
MNEKEFLAESLKGYDTIRAAYASRLSSLGEPVVDPPVVDPPIIVPPSSDLLAEGTARVGVWMQGTNSQLTIDSWRNLGIDMFVGHWKNLTLADHNLMDQNSLPYVLEATQEEVYTESTGIMVNHEPDIHPQNPPSEILAEAKAYKEGGGKQPVYVFFGKGICVEGWYGMGPSNGQPWSGAGAGFEYYKTICESPYVDGLMFDYYPYNAAPTKQKKIGAANGTPVVDDPEYVIDGLKRLKQFSNGKPVYASLSASRIKRELFETPPSLTQNKAIVQDLLANGVDGIIWFAHDFEDGKYVTDRHPLTIEGVTNGTANMVKVCSNLVREHFSGVIVDPPVVIVDPPVVIVDPPVVIVDPPVVEPPVNNLPEPFEGQRSIQDIKDNAGCDDGIRDLPISPSVTIKTDGTVLENMHLNATIRVKADNVIIRNCFITGAGYYGIQSTFGHKNLLIENCTIRDQSSCGIYTGSNTHIRDCYITESGSDGMKVQGDDVLVEGCWVRRIGTIPSSHADCVQSRGSNHRNSYYNNYFDIPFYDSSFYEDGYKSNACFMIQSDLGPITDIVIKNNWLRGGSYMVYFTHKDTKNFLLQGLLVEDNFFSREGSRLQGAKSTLMSVKDTAKDVVIKGNLWFEAGDLDGMSIPNNQA